MVIEVHLHTILQRRTEAGVIRKTYIELPPASTLAVVLDMLEIDFPVEDLLLVVNGKSVGLKHRISDGDIVHIIPALSGGGDPRRQLVR